MSFGIDFGTTNSAVVYEINNKLDTHGNRPFPSIVAINKLDGHIIAGSRAKERLDDLASGDYVVIPSVKSYLGTNHLWKADRSYSAQEVTTILLRELKRHAEQHSTARGHALDKAVVAVPVGYAARARNELREAASSAGINISTFVSEPTAAFFQYRDSIPQCQHVLVFDWGGGTLDVSVLRIEKDDRIRELATESLHEAGDEIDELIAHWLHERLASKHKGLPGYEQVPTRDKVRLRSQCEQAKCRLSEHADSRVQLNRYLTVNRVDELFTRGDLDSLIKPLIDDAMATVYGTVKRAGIEPELLDKVLTVGGSSRLIAIQQRMQETFNVKLHHTLDEPAWAVAQGASRLATAGEGAYKPTHPIYLILSDGTPIELIRGGDVFGGGEHRLRLAVVEETKSAQLVFAESISKDDGDTQRRPIFGLSVPIQGFDYEPVELTCRLTDNLTFLASAKGQNMKDSPNKDFTDRAQYEYARMRFVYQLPS